MSSRLNHIIRNMHLEVEFQGHADAFELRNTLTHVCKRELLPALEKLFDDKGQRGRIIKADNIVIDLGVIDNADWNKTLVYQVVQQLTKYFSQATPLYKTISSKASRDEESVESFLDLSNTITQISEEENSFQSILHFLKTGLLPWHSFIKGQGKFVRELSRLINEADKVFYKQILAMVRGDDYVLTRLINQVPEEILQSIVLLSGKITSKDINVVLNSWTKIFESVNIMPIPHKRVIYQAAVLVISETYPKQISAEAINERVIKILTPGQLQKVYAFLGKQEHSTFFQSLDDVEKKIIQYVLETSKDKVLGIGNAGTSVHQSKPASSKVKDFSESNRKGTEAYNDIEGLNKSNRKVSEAYDEVEGLFINNAGLVILHPFLLSLFENVGYIEEKKWVSESLQQRAVLLTQFLVTGKQEYPEFDLFLNKLLVGYPLEESLPADILLSDFEMQEGQDVLKSVLTHWKVLKNTSAPVLQSTFFQREGKILYSDNRWLLQVEQKTVDILLNKLPWGIGIIKLPWMESRLHVEWT